MKASLRVRFDSINLNLKEKKKEIIFLLINLENPKFNGCK